MPGADRSRVQHGVRQGKHIPAHPAPLTGGGRRGPQAVVAGEGPVVGPRGLQALGQEGVVPGLVPSHLDKVGEESGGQAVVWVRAEAGDDVPGQVHGPVLDVDEGVEEGLAGGQAAALPALQLPWLYELELRKGGGIGGGR